MPSDIHVLVHFHDQCIFAGEELRCTITFKNILDQLGSPKPLLSSRRSSRTTSIGKLAALRQSSARSESHQSRVSSRHPSHGGQQPLRTALRRPSVTGSHSPQSAPEGVNQQQRPNHKQQRSVSIFSGGTPVGSPSPDGFPTSAGQRPTGSHRRSSTIQVSSGTLCVDLKHFRTR